MLLFLHLMEPDVARLVLPKNSAASPRSGIMTQLLELINRPWCEQELLSITTQKKMPPNLSPIPLFFWPVIWCISVPTTTHKEVCGLSWAKGHDFHQSFQGFNRTWTMKVAPRGCAAAVLHTVWYKLPCVVLSCSILWHSRVIAFTFLLWCQVF